MLFDPGKRPVQFCNCSPLFVWLLHGLTRAVTLAHLDNIEMETSMNTIRLMTSNEAARFLQVSRRTLDRLRARKTKIGAIKVGGQVRYHKDILEEYLRKRADK